MFKKLNHFLLACLISLPILKGSLNDNGKTKITSFNQVKEAQIDTPVSNIDYDYCNQAYYEYLDLLNENNISYEDTIDIGLQEYVEFSSTLSPSDPGYNQVNSNIAIARNLLDANSSTHVVGELVFSATLLFLSILGISALAYAEENFKFAVELLDHASLMIDDTYSNPTYKGRMLSNPTLLQYAKGLCDSSSYNADLKNCRNQIDTYLSIHSCNLSFKDEENMIINVDDRYDFNKDAQYDDDFWAATFNKIGHTLVQLHQISEFKVNFDIDVSKYLEITSYSSYSNRHLISIKNNSSRTRTVYYNNKLTSYNKASAWYGLNDCTSLTIASNSISSFYVNNDGLNKYLAMSIIEEGKRYITIADGFGGSTPLNTELREKGQIEEKDGIKILGKTDSNWNVQVTNNASVALDIDYYPNTVTQNKAASYPNEGTWQSISLAANSTTVLNIENTSSKYIGIRKRGDTTETRYVLSNYNTNGRFDVTSNTLPLVLYLTLTNLGKASGKWTIRIKNDTGITQSIYYNKKMCFENDAKNWANLRDVDQIIIPNGRYQDVAISENLFANSITTSYIKNNHRIITYARGLTTSGGINCMTNYI